VSSLRWIRRPSISFGGGLNFMWKISPEIGSKRRPTTRSIREESGTCEACTARDLCCFLACQTKPSSLRGEQLRKRPNMLLFNIQGATTHTPLHQIINIAPN
jgi:hypothetical protein